MQFTFEKITCCAKREKKITCHEENPTPPPWISNGPSLSHVVSYELELYFSKNGSVIHYYTLYQCKIFLVIMYTPQTHALFQNRQDIQSNTVEKVTLDFNKTKVVLVHLDDCFNQKIRPK